MKKSLEILVAEHDPDVAEGLCDILEMAGHNVQRAFSPEETCELVRRNDFHVGFVNVKMPGLSKLESFAEVRKIKPDANLILMSAHTIDKLIAEFTHDGVVRVLTAPVTTGNVVDVLGNIGPMGTLLIEDVPANFATAIQAALKQRNINVGIAHDGGEALARVAEGNIDVLLLDLHLTVVRSLEVYLGLKQQGLSLPTIIFQSYADDRSAIHSISDVDILFKPFDPALMVRLLDEMAAKEGGDTASPAPALSVVADVGDRADQPDPQGALAEFGAEPVPPPVPGPSAAEYHGPSAEGNPAAASEKLSPIAETPVQAEEPDNPPEAGITRLKVEESPDEARLPAGVGITAEQLEQAVIETGTAGLAPNDEAPSGGREAPETSSKGVRVLVVDDDHDVADGLVELLAITGLDVNVAYSSEGALATLKDFDAQIALVDVQLGENSGLELIAQLKLLRPEVIVVMVTGQTELQTAITALRKGAFDYLNKPLEPEELLAAMDRCFEELAKRKARATAPQAAVAAAHPEPTSAEYMTKLSQVLGTPLNPSVGLSEVLSEEMLERLGATQIEDYAHDTTEARKHLMDVIEEFAGIDKSESGKLEVNEDAVDLTRVIFRCLEHIQPAVDAGDLTVEIELTEIPVFVIGDRYKLTQITLSLLTNAVKFTPKQGTIRFIQRRHEDGGIVIEVIDTGIGISEEVISQALTSAIESNGDLKSDYEGSGLSLPLALSMAELHDGELSLDSEVGTGTTATLRMPPERNIAFKRSIAV